MPVGPGFLEMPPIRESRSSSASCESIPSDIGSARPALLESHSEGEVSSTDQSLVHALLTPDVTSSETDVYTSQESLMDELVRTALDFVETCGVQALASDFDHDLDWSQLLKKADDVSELSMFDELTVLYGRQGTRFTALAVDQTQLPRDRNSLARSGAEGEPEDFEIGEAALLRAENEGISNDTRWNEGRPIARVPSWLELDVSTPVAVAGTGGAPAAPVPPDFGLLRRPPMSSGRLRTLTEEDAEAGLSLLEATDGSASKHWYLSVQWDKFNGTKRMAADVDAPWLARCGRVLCHPAWTQLEF